MKQTTAQALCAALFLLSCSTGEGVISRTDDTEIATDVRGEPDGLGPFDAQDEPDGTGEPSEDSVDLVPLPDLPAGDAPDSQEPACAPGEGCFLDPCSENGECQSGWCVLHMGQSVCTTACQEECPAGWSCKQVAGTEPDIVYVCVSNAANLCKPCATAADCTSPAGQSDACIVLPGEGSFCGAPCQEGECPWGFSCATAETVNGVPLDQCLPDTGMCPCTDTSVALGLWTPCDVTNEAGTCSGKRVCTEDGLTECDAPEPAAEACNGLDDDCDGEVDEPTLVEGSYEELCDDGNPCTEDSCLGEAGCQSAALTEGECTDGNPCTVADHCEAGVCVGQGVDCDDGNPCTDDACGEAGGCSYEYNTADCDDGDPCTLGDECTEGTCVGIAMDCQCQVDADCDKLEDGDLCNGTLVCDKGQLPYQCVVDPETVVLCPEPADGPDAICLKAACDPLSGACSLEPDHEAYACEDGDPCTVGDLCQAGVCTAGEPANCNDGNPCTDESCEPGVGCTYTNNQAPCSDGDDCTVGDHCEQGLCISGQPLACDDSNPCTTDSCQPETGCIHAPADGACDDGNECTVGDHCAGGKCVYSGALACDDDNVCTTDSCDPEQGCLHLLNQAPCADGDVCTTGDHCHLGECISSGTLNCDDGNACTDDSCNPQTGCQFTPNNAPCDDGNECTTVDLCTAGACQGTVPPDCNDSNPCTTDTCDPQQGCLAIVNALPCDDGDLCTIDDQCAEGSCQPGEPMACDDGNGCTDDSCDPQTGCQFTPNNALCDDADACTTTDVCSGGQCVGSDPLFCDDGNGCTTDTCDPAQGCLYEPLTPCCGNGQVEAGEQCDDGNTQGGDGCSESCQLEALSCGPGAVSAGQHPNGNMMLCEDPAHNTCEQNFEQLCPAGWHLCTYEEFSYRNDGWNQTVNAPKRALGVIYCRTGGGAGHFTIPDAGSNSHNLGSDESHNCYYGSSRPSCPAGYGCNEAEAMALCCSPNPLCGNGAVDSPEEGCDDGNDSDSDSCLSVCTKRVPGGGGTNCGG